MNKFIILVGSRNNSQWVDSNISSILLQDYKNYHVVYYDDASEDDTEKNFKKCVGDNPKFTYIRSDNRKLKTWFYDNLDQYISINDNDILVFLDGDDMFYCENVLSYLNAVYNQNECWLTYGGMIVWEGDENISKPYPQNSEIPPQVIKNKLYRKDMWRTSHLKSMTGAIWKQIDKKDLIYDGKYIVGPDDLAIMFAALEICPPNKLFRIEEPVYLYNHTDLNQKSRAYTDNINNKTDYESVIRNRTQYKEISIVNPQLVGGLGNQMFEIAAAASLAKDNNALLTITNENHILLNQGRKSDTYLSNIFNKITTDSKPNLQNVYIKNTSDYSPIVYQPNLQLRGHFQSFMYFDHNREYIKKLFLNEKIIDELKTKYKIPNDSTAVQVRRGDYQKFPDHHPMLSVEYYKEAIKKVNSSKIYIFSDDIDWCKVNLNFDIPVEYVKDEDYNELYLISLCKNIIISNSSFGWWGAYLNKLNSTVIAPSVWFGKSLLKDGFNIDDLLLKEWIRI